MSLMVDSMNASALVGWCSTDRLDWAAVMIANTQLQLETRASSSLQIDANVLPPSNARLSKSKCRWLGPVTTLDSVLKAVRSEPHVDEKTSEVQN